MIALAASAWALDPALEPYRPLVGHWTRGKASETWVDAGDRLVGVAFAPGPGPDPFFEILALERRADGVVYVARPLGGEPTAFRAEGWTFRAPEHDFPQWIAYLRERERLTARIGDEAREISFRWKLSAPPPDGGVVRAERARGGEPIAAGMSADERLAWTITATGVTIWERADAGWRERVSAPEE